VTPEGERRADLAIQDGRIAGIGTIGDAAKSLGRYRPFILLVAAVLAVVVILPGKPGPKQNSASSVQTGENANG